MPDKWKAVYTLVERNEVGRRPLFLRVGTAWPNKDGSINIRLDAMPVNGMLHIRDYEPSPPDGSFGTKGQG